MKNLGVAGARGQRQRRRLSGPRVDLCRPGAILEDRQAVTRAPRSLGKRLIGSRRPVPESRRSFGKQACPAGARLSLQRGIVRSQGAQVQALTATKEAGMFAPAGVAPTLGAAKPQGSEPAKSYSATDKWILAVKAGLLEVSRRRDPGPVCHHVCVRGGDRLRFRRARSREDAQPQEVTPWSSAAVACSRV
jgi:hypothetical protein